MRRRKVPEVASEGVDLDIHPGQLTRAGPDDGPFSEQRLVEAACVLGYGAWRMLQQVAKLIQRRGHAVRGLA